MIKKFPQEWLEQISLLLKNHPLVLMKQRKITTPLQFSWSHYRPNSSDDISYRLVRADPDRRDFASQLLKNVYFCHGRTSVALIWDGPGEHERHVLTDTHYDHHRKWFRGAGPIFPHFPRWSGPNKQRPSRSSEAEAQDPPRAQGEQKQGGSSTIERSQFENANEEELL